MKSSGRSSADTLTLAAGILATTALAWLLAEKLADVELLVSHNLFDMFASAPRDGTPAAATSVNHTPGTTLIRIGITSGFAAFGTIAAYLLSRKLRWIVLIQLIALNLVLHIILVTSGVSLAMPISLTVASACGIAFGCLVKQYKDARQQLEGKDVALESMDKELADSKLQMIKDDESERRVLAADLHDQVLNDLKLLREKVNQVSTDKPDSSKQQEMDTLIVRSMQQIREVMDSLSPAVLQHLGFVDAIEDCVRNGSERGSYKVRFRCGIEHSEFDAFNQIELTLLYRLVQESITNVCKHAGATTVKCVITADGGKITIRIIDDGKGMDQSAASTPSRGLKYMRQRADLIGASVNWLPGDDGKGTTVDITITKPK